MLKPSGKMASYVQAIWSVTIDCSSHSQFSRWLQGDACSGIIINLANDITLDKQSFARDVIFMPVSKKAQQVNLASGCQLVGMRFHEGVSAALLGQTFSVATSISETNIDMGLPRLAQQLLQGTSRYYRLRLVYRWLINMEDVSTELPTDFLTALRLLQQASSVEALVAQIAVSQRQIERQYRKLLDMTPAQYLRLMRVKRTLEYLKEHPQMPLAVLALENGFSDQSHMTREFKEIAAITPLNYLKQLASLR